MLQLQDVFAQLLESEMKEVILFLPCLRFYNANFILDLLVDCLKRLWWRFEIGRIKKVRF